MFSKGGSYERVFMETYKRRRVSKQLLADSLQLSLPTVRSCLRALEQRGIVVRQGSYAPTGGRPATAYEFVPDARHAIGVEAAAYAELWRHRELADFVYLSLNQHLGSAVIREGALLRGGPLGSGVAEHMVLYPGGRRCYCGNEGCAETVLGAAALKSRASLPLGDFFARVRADDAGCKRLWHDYLDDLALLIHNMRMVTCADVVLGGYMANYLNDKDLRTLRMLASSHGALGQVPFRLVKGQYSDRATITGAGLILVDEYLANPDMC